MTKKLINEDDSILTQQSTHLETGSLEDFAHQTHRKLGLSHDEFTIVTFDLPGQGSSTCLVPSVKCPLKTPPLTAQQKMNNEPDYFSALPTMEYFELCADTGASLMASLGHKTYSVAGWSDGARVASLLAIRHQSRVNSLLLWAFVPIMDKHSCEAISRTRDTDTWDPEALKVYTKVYGGQERFSDYWKAYVDFIMSTLEFPDHFDIRNLLSKIKCPTLVLHGKQDPIVDYRQHVEPLNMQIYNSEIQQLDGLAQNIHQSNPSQFNALLAKFVENAAY